MAPVSAVDDVLRLVQFPKVSKRFTEVDEWLTLWLTAKPVRKLVRTESKVSSMVSTVTRPWKRGNIGAGRQCSHPHHTNACSPQSARSGKKVARKWQESGVTAAVTAGSTVPKSTGGINQQFAADLRNCNPQTPPARHSRRLRGCATVPFGARHTIDNAGNLPDSEVFSRPYTSVYGAGSAYP